MKGMICPPRNANGLLPVVKRLRQRKVAKRDISIFLHSCVARLIKLDGKMTGRKRCALQVTAL
jgi:hypothetical protein